uniref:PWWP domain-containing protein n=1 Tax=Anopheles maculatus TaxID=74869 RepID=A0A182SET9_9DIPT
MAPPRASGIGSMRRGPAVKTAQKQQPEHRVKLSIAVPSTPTEGSTCLLTDVLPAQSYDVTPSLSENSTTTTKSRTMKRLRRSPSVSDGTVARTVEPLKGSRQFRVGDLVWGAIRGSPAWPGKVVPAPPSLAATTVPPTNASDSDELKAPASAPADGAIKPSSERSPATDAQQQAHVWVRWFGPGRASAERVEVETLQSLSEGLEIHHRAQKDARKSRKLNAQLELAIQQAMQELDHAASSSGCGRCGTDRGKPRQHRRHQRRQPPPPGKRHRTVVGGGNGSNSVNANMCNRKGGRVRYLRGNKFKAKS